MKKSKGIGIGIGFVLCGLILLDFPGFVGMQSWGVWVFWLIGLMLVLVGVMGLCVELFGGDEHGE